MTREVNAILAAIRAGRWAILPEYLEAIEALAMRCLTSDVLDVLRNDGHEARLAAGLNAIAATGNRLEGTGMSTLRDGAAVIPVFGPIFPRANMVNSSAGGASLDAIMQDFRVAEASAQVERIVMVFDSPGGQVSGLGEAAEALRSGSKPLTAFVTGMAASAAYWLASQADEIVVESAAAVGSIGVVANLSRQVGPDQSGRVAHEIVSSGAPLKRPDPTTDEGRAALQAEVDAFEVTFIADVATGRKVKASTVRSEFGRGAMVAASQAVAAGMADRIGTLESVLKERRRTGGNPYGGSRALAAAKTDVRRRAALNQE